MLGNKKRVQMGTKKKTEGKGIATYTTEETGKRCLGGGVKETKKLKTNRTLSARRRTKPPKAGEKKSMKGAVVRAQGKKKTDGPKIGRGVEKKNKGQGQESFTGGIR